MPLRQAENCHFSMRSDELDRTKTGLMMFLDSLRGMSSLPAYVDLHVPLFCNEAIAAEEPCFAPSVVLECVFMSFLHAYVSDIGFGGENGDLLLLTLGCMERPSQRTGHFIICRATAVVRVPLRDDPTFVR